MARDLSDVLKEGGPEAIRASYAEAVLKKKLNGGDSHFQDETQREEADRREREKAKVELPKGFIPGSEMRPSDPPQIIKGMLPSRGTGLGVGQSGAGKTVIFIDMGLAIASGTPFFEHEVRRKGGVVYIAAEGAGGIDNRVSAAKIHRGIDQDIPFVCNKSSYNLKEDAELDGLIFDLKQTGAWFQQEFGVPLRLTIIDTVSQAFNLENENDNAEVVNICKRLSRIDAETEAFCLGIYHAGKNQEAGARGASAWRGNVDNMYMCAADRDEVTGECKNRCLSLSKYRDGPEGPISGYSLEYIELGLDEDGEPFKAPAITLTDVITVKAKKNSVTPDERLFDDAFSEAAISHGKEIQVDGDGPKVMAVAQRHIRQEFYKRRSTGEDDKDKRKAASKKAFQRLLPRISWRYVTDASGEEEVMWKR